MSLPVQTPIAAATGNGVTTVFPFAFLVDDDANLVVTITDTLGAVSTKVLGVDYTVSGTGVVTGGSVNFTTAPANGSLVVSYRQTPVDRSTDYIENGDLGADTLNGDFDRLVMILQELLTGGLGSTSSIRVPANETLPRMTQAPLARAGLYLVFDASGNPTVASGSGTDAALRADLAAATGSALVGWQASGASTTRPVRDKLREVSVSPEDFNASAGDGVTDSYAAFVLAIATGKTVNLTHGRDYLIKTGLVMNTGQWITCDGMATITMDTGAGNFDETGGNIYDTKGVGILWLSSTDGGMRGVRMRLSNRTDELKCGAVAIRGCVGTVIEDCEFTNYAKASVVHIDSCNYSGVRDCAFYSCTTNSAVATGQVTAISIDDNRLGGGSPYPSVGCFVEGCSIRDITVGAAFLALYGYQADGISVGHESSSLHRIANNTIVNTGEGIDCFGANCLIENNVLVDCYNYGVKLVHGATHNKVQGNRIANPGLSGIVISGSSTDSNHTEYNDICDNQISNVNIYGFWTGSTPTGIRCSDDGGAKHARFNRIRNNFITDGAAMDRGLLDENAGVLNRFTDNYVENWITDEFFTAGASTYVFRSAVKAVVRAGAAVAQSITNSVPTTLALATEAMDDTSEFASNTFTAKVPRKLRVSASIRTGAATAAKTWRLSILKNGTAVAHSDTASASTVVNVTVSDTISVVKGDTIAIQIFHNEAAPVLLSTGVEYVRLEINEV